MKKKLKINLSGQAVKQMLANHIEKAIFGLIVIVVLLLMDRGFRSRNPFSGKLDYTPQSLKTQAGQAEANIKKPNVWYNEETKIGVRDTRDKDLKLPDRLNDSLANVPVSAYPTPTLISPDLLQERALRVDPNLLPPVDLELYAGTGPLAIKSEGGGGTRGKPLPAGLEQRIPGYRGGGSGSKITAQGVSFVVISAKIPIRMQTKIFQDAFLTSPGFDPERDRPRYVYFYIQRVEVMPDGSESDPVQLITGNITNAADQWADKLPEVVPPEYCLPKLTMGLQPLMLRPSEPWQKHSAFPLIGEEKETPTDTTQEQEATEDVPGGDDIPDLESASPQQPTGRQPAPHQPNDPQRPGRNPPKAERLVDFKMLRVYDYGVLPGHTYRYAVRLILEDPNDPNDSSKKPARTVLDKPVIERLDSGSIEIAHCRSTDWSKQTDPITVPVSDKMLAGPVELGRFTSIDREGNGYFEEEPKGKVMVVAWDKALAADVAGETEVIRGSLLNFAEDVEFLDPVTMTLQPAPGHAFKTNTLVLDIAGGEDISGSNRREQLFSSGQMLLLDPNGNLVVVDEIEDSSQRIMHQYDKLAEALSNAPVVAPATPTQPATPTEPSTGGHGTPPPPDHGGVESDFFSQ